MQAVCHQKLALDVFGALALNCLQPAMPRASSTNGKPLWRCPKCRKYYVTRNIWHACARHTLKEHFAKRDPNLKILFDGVVGLLRRNGSLRVNPGKTVIAFQVRMRFCGVYVRKRFLELGFLLPRRVDDPRIGKVIAYSRRCYGHHVKIETLADLDEQLAGWLRESYRVGQQAELLRGQQRPSVEAGDFDWSRFEMRNPARSASQEKPRAREDFRVPEGNRVLPAWHCPKCGRRLPARNQIHICSDLTLPDALRGKTPHSIALFRKITAVARKLGPFGIVPQRTRIGLQRRKLFLGIRFLRRALDCEIPLPRRIEDARFRQILSASPGAHYHYLRLAAAREINAQFRSWLREAFRAAQ